MNLLKIVTLLAIAIPVGAQAATVGAGFSLQNNEWYDENGQSVGKLDFGQADLDLNVLLSLDKPFEESQVWLAAWDRTSEDPIELGKPNSLETNVYDSDPHNPILAGFGEVYLLAIKPNDLYPYYASMFVSYNSKRGFYDGVFNLSLSPEPTSGWSDPEGARTFTTTFGGTTIVTPIPGAVALFAPALLGLIGIYRFRLVSPKTSF